MKLTIATSGGIGNIRIRGEIDTAQLDDVLAERAQSILVPGRLASLRRDGVGRVADGTQYELGVFREDGIHTYTVDEAAAPREIVEVLQALVREIILRKHRS
jgi:hypothetical protein